MSKSTTLTSALVAHVARLANLPTTPAEINAYTGDLASVLEYISLINQLDTADVVETNQVTGLTNVFREDEIDTGRMLTQEQALSQAARTHNNYFVVAAVIDQ